MNKHTPAPWHVADHLDKETEIRSLAVWRNDDRIICLITPKVVEDEEDVANASLIAAAPELYDACYKLINCSHQEHFAVRLNDEEMEALEAIKFALAKANTSPY